MSEFDFTAVKAKTVKPADVPAITRTRQIAVNPLAETFLTSFTKGTDADGKGTWLALVLPVQDAGEKAPLGTVIKQAAQYLRRAAAVNDKGVDIRTSDNEDGFATLHFRGTPRRERKAKTAK